MCIYTGTNLKLHSLPTSWSFHYLTHPIRKRWEIGLKIALSVTLHIGENRLTKMPTEKLIDWPKWIITEALVQLLAGNSIAASKRTKTDDLVAILKPY